jgi:hypothetical protein
MRFRSIPAACTLLLLPFLAQAQSDSSHAWLRPTFSLGAGMFAFYGDIGSQHSDYSPLVTRVGYEFRASSPLNDWLELGLYAVHGKLGANERSTSRNLNFISRVTTGGLQLTYNFYQLLPEKHSIEPFITLGFESVEFLSKTDLRDAEGRTYHYWSDGTIRSLDEHAANAGEAVMLTRDYTYESDIRELDLDGFGKYSERTWAVPVGIGAKMKLEGGFDVRFSTTMHFAFSDLMDGVTDASVNERQGDSKNDRFLFSSVSVSYALDLDKKKRERALEPTISGEQLDVIVLKDDEDLDGVPDFRDDCPMTPSGAKVNEHGCPVDTDMDGVADVNDDEPNTAIGAPVDAHGVTITDEQFLKDFLNYKDSGNVTIISSRVESLSPKRKEVAEVAQRVYVIQVGSEMEGITEEQMQQLLSIPDIRTVEHGDTVSFVVGGYDALPEAIRRQLQLNKDGIQGRVMVQEGNRLIDASDEVAKAQGNMEAPAPSEKGRSVMRVQLGAFKNKLSKNIFAGIPDIMTIHGDDGLTRYYTGAFTNVNEAAQRRVDMLTRGFSGAFIVAFKDGKRVSLREAGAKVTRPETLDEKPVSGFNKDLVRYRVQLGSFAGNVPADVMSKYVEIGNVTPITGTDDTRYVYGSFKTRAEAMEALKVVQEKGVPDAFVVGEMQGRIISADDADRLLNE